MNEPEKVPSIHELGEQLWTDEQLDSFPAELLKSAMTEQYTQFNESASNLLFKGSMMIASLDRRGVDVSDLDAAYVEWCREIAAGRYLPQLLVKCQIAHNQAATQALRRLTLTDQQRLNNGEIKLAIFETDKVIDHRVADLPSLRAHEIRQLIGAKGINNETEQLRVWKLNQKPQMKSPEFWECTPDCEAGEIIVEGTKPQIRLAKGEVDKARAKMMSSEPDDDPKTEKVYTKLSKKQNKELKITAANAHCETDEMIRRALILAAYIR